MFDRFEKQVCASLCRTGVHDDGVAAVSKNSAVVDPPRAIGLHIRKDSIVDIDEFGRLNMSVVMSVVATHICTVRNSSPEVNS